MNPTTGPWHLHEEGARPVRQFWILSRSNTTIATLGAETSDVPAERDKPNADLIVAACNACQAINPSDPQFVADEMATLVSALKITWSQTASGRADYTAALKVIEAFLARLEG